MYETENFTPETDPMMSCPCCGKGGLSVALLIVLEDIRRELDKPVTITSGARCVKHNAKVGGAKNSEHKVTDEDPNSDAADIKVKDVTPTQLYVWLKSRPYANLIALGKYKSWVHVDVRGYGARW